MDRSGDRLRVEAISIAGLPARVVARCGSTNAALLEERGAGPLLLAAEEQTAGRGRRGRRWRSAPGTGATFSILRRMRCAPAALSGLSLAVGVACARALRDLGAGETQVKWPNDLVVEGAKLGGILIETRAGGGETTAVIGIGINCRDDPALARRLRRRVAALDAFVQPAPSRNAVIAAVAREVMAALETFERAGLAPFVAEWTALHAHEGARLKVRLADGRTLSGLARGIAASGALRIATARGLREVASGRIVQGRGA
jgi:BirA family biotin operon repressor/biotin-[acetyl-CoA-carboxylase] ligase